MEGWRDGGEGFVARGVLLAAGPFPHFPVLGVPATPCLAGCFCCSVRASSAAEGKPLKRLPGSRIPLHRAKAAVLMRFVSGAGEETPGESGGGVMRIVPRTREIS